MEAKREVHRVYQWTREDGGAWVHVNTYASAQAAQDCVRAIEARGYAATYETVLVPSTVEVES